MGTIIGWLIGKQMFGRTISEPAARLIAHAGLVLVVLAVLGSIVAFVRRDAVDDHEAKIVQRAAPATAKAADERVADAVRIATQERKMHDVIEAQPDQAIAPTSRALGCERLRRAGRTSPACS